MKKFKGSLTIEATIAFTIFMSFMFMLMMLVKLAMTVIVLDTVTGETAKQVATSAYPLSFYIDYADENDKKMTSYLYGTGEMKFVGNTVKNSVVSALLSSLGLSTATYENIKEDTFFGLVKGIIDVPMTALKQCATNIATDFIGKKGFDMVSGEILNGLKDSGVSMDFSKLRLVVCKLPMPKSTYESDYKNVSLEAYDTFNLSGNDFSAEDVVIGLTYDYDITLPFIGTFTVKLKSIAIEHGWLNGCNSEALPEAEGIKLEEILFGKYFYATTTGKYHKASCRALLMANEGNVKKVSILELNSNAKYSPCKICKPKIKEELLLLKDK